MSRFTIGQQLGIGIAALGSLVVLLSFMSLRVIGGLGQELDSAVNKTARKIELIGSTRLAFQELKHESLREQISYMILELEGRQHGQSPPGKRGADCSGCHAPAAVAESLQAMEAAERGVRKRTAELRSLVSDETSRKAVAAIDERASVWLTNCRQYLALAESKRFEEAHQILRDRMLPTLADVEKAATVLAQNERDELTQSGQQTTATIRKSRLTAFILIGVNILVAGAVLWLVRRVISDFRTALVEMRVGSEQVAAAAGQVASASSSLADGASRQAASLEETSASSIEINSMAHSNSQRARAVAALVTQSQQKFAETNHSLDAMIQSIGEINTHSDRISKIIKVIDEIAFQTNILALNAAVEAARAGEAGMGFAVVADEVRNLAQRSAQAARDTAKLIEESIDKSSQGKVRVDLVAAAIRRITEESAQIRTLMDEVNSGSQQQTQRIEEVAKAISHMEQVTQTTAATAEESASAAEELNAHSTSWKQVVDRLSAMVGGASDEPAGGGAASRSRRI